MKTFIVEDDFTSRMILQTIMQNFGEVHIAVNGIEAVTAVKSAIENKETYSLICMDIMMPEMDGHEALKQIRELEKTHKIEGLDRVKVLMTSALKDSKTVMSAFRDECDGYIVKPVNKKALITNLVKLGLVVIKKDS